MNCKVVVESNLVTDSPKWRAFNSEERNARSRVGDPSTFTVHDKTYLLKLDGKIETLLF
ncbi:MAG: hypothetical protein ACTSYA_01365 [Candidatus Kariarchaeaceae archaeon]